MIILNSCNCEKVNEKIEVTYINNKIDTISLTYHSCSNNDCGGVFFYNGCIYTHHEETKYDVNYKGCVVCGVRKYRKLN